ncbi:hypothetical protein [Ensifer sesbaniae]|nr:hypothetical protein [Ensifer sesbaniae]
MTDHLVRAAEAVRLEGFVIDAETAMGTPASIDSDEVGGFGRIPY